MPRKQGGGGSYAVNWHIQNQLHKQFSLQTSSPLVPRISKKEQLKSRVQRYILRRPSDFFYFSESMLQRNAERIDHRITDQCDGVFFRSATRWSHSKPEVPYFVYLDIVFHTFFENTFDSKDFSKSDLDRIYGAEAQFLERASAVFFESDWGLQKARKAYSLSGEHYYVSGRGGLMAPPEQDDWTRKSLLLISVAMNFTQKGGDIILKSFERLKKEFPALKWHIVGGRPSGNWKDVEGITYEGVLDPEDPIELTRLRGLMSRAFLLLHPTREDTNPLVLTEAAYFGCPSVSVDQFAIPELVLNGETGILLDFPARASDLTEAVRQLIHSPQQYEQMRKSAFEFSHSQFDWDAIGERMAGIIREKLS